MPNRIQLLPEVVANQIAAGEVIERPASVLKELIENSLDAGATQIDVITRGGGRSLIQVTDNGCGMSRDDALLCLERHATSKIRSFSDLAKIGSYGFRGEAIPSIASVSRFRLRTREPEAVSGTEIVIQGGKMVNVQDTGLAPGTQIEIRSLFFNLPARRKFLRTENTESAHIQHQLILAGLSRPDVGFTMIHDDHAPVRWPADQDLENRLGSIYGANWLKMLIPIQASEGEIRLSGFIGRPGVSRGNRQEELFFVNRRPVDNRTLHYGLMEGYHNALMKGRFPVAVLFLEIDPAALDVNIHPAKREVRFHDDATLRHFVVRAVQETLRELEQAPLSVPLTVPEKKSVPVETPSAPSPEPAATPQPLRQETLAIPATPPPASKQTVISPEVVVPLARQIASASSPVIPEKKEAEEKRQPFRVLGIVANLYIVAESPEGLVLIDQHAAHERILFEQMLRRVAAEETVSQRLLIPTTVQLPPREADFLQAQMETLNRIGLEISLFGPGTFLVDGLPPMVKTGDVGEFIRILVSDLEENGGETYKQRRLSEDVIAKTVCRHAVKANDRLRPEECDRLIADLLACDLPYTCPHGRPTMIQLSKAELEKKFGRVT